jgi:hypothetical protein
MRLIDMLIIAACLGVGYWIVNSVIGGNDKKGKPGGSDEDAPAESPKPSFESVLKPSSPTSPAPRTLPSAAVTDWHILLDVPRDATPRDIQAAMKRRISQANADGDSAAAERIRRAGDYALKQKQTP